MKVAYLCVACATQFPPSERPPVVCPICIDSRQFVPRTGQTWTTADSICRRHSLQVRQHEPNLIGIGLTPQFAIGQRAILVQTSGGNLLWDCLPVLDEAAYKIITALGGLDAIAISHPHYYAGMREWSQAFGKVKVFIHEADEKWIVDRHDSVQLWGGDTHRLFGNVTLINVGGHFSGGTVAHWSEGASGKGVLLSGDVIMTLHNANFVSFMRSYPNLIPLGRKSVERIASQLAPYEFDRIYGAFFDRFTPANGKSILDASVGTYIDALNDQYGERP